MWRPAAGVAALALALSGAFFLGQAQAQGGINFSQPSLLYQPINADKTADYEAVVGRLREAIQKGSPALRRQGQGWKIYRLGGPAQNGTVNYVHVIEQPVSGANYALMPILYDAFDDPDQQTAIYDQYREAFGGNPTAVGLTLVADLGQ